MVNEPKTDAEKIAAAKQRYACALRAMQSGVAATSEARARSPKHLRVGVNSALVDSGALAALLIAKGVITEVEYAEALAFGMEREVNTYEARLSAEYGMPVTLK